MYCVVATRNHNQVQGTKANHKLKLMITRAVCSLVFSRLNGFFFATQ